MVTKFTEQITLDFDANASNTTVPIKIFENNFVFMQIIAASGAHTTHTIILECSANKVIWHPVPGGSVIGVGIVDNLQVTAGFIRARVSLVEGVASTVDVYLQAK